MRKQLIINRLANCGDTLDEPPMGGNPSLFSIGAIDFIPHFHFESYLLTFGPSSLSIFVPVWTR